MSSLAISGSAFIVTPFIPFVGSNRGRGLLKLMNAFSVGGLLGDVFLHIIPHSAARMLCEGASHGNHVHSGNELLFAAPLLAGILLFFLSENLVSKLNPSSSSCGHSHSMPPPQPPSSASPSKRKTSASASPPPPSVSSEGPESQSHAKVILLVLADLLHNFTDGLALGVSWRLGRGRSTTVAVFMHEVPHNIADFALLVGQGMRTTNALKLQFITALGTVAGAWGGSLAIMSFGPWLELFVAGGFMYLSLCNILPTLVQTRDVSMMSAVVQSVAVCGGVWLMVLMLQFEGDGH